MLLFRTTINNMKKYFDYSIFVLAAALGLFFIYKGVNKHFLSPCKTFGPESTIPLMYQEVVTGLCKSGFTTMIGVLQILSGALLIIPRLRLFGAILLMPVITSIFTLHLFLDNRPHEFVETGIPLAATVLIILYHFPKWKSIFARN